MDLSLFLAQLLGIYFLVVGVLVVLRRDSFMPIIAELGHNRPLVFTIAIFELAVGLSLALSHSIFTFDYRGIISVIGWTMLIEGVLYLALPFPKVRKIFKTFNKSGWYLSGGTLSIVAGVYLAGIGFGFWS